MSEEETVVLTQELFKRGVSTKGAISRKQAECFGLDWNNLERGWIRKLIGQEFPKKDIDRFLELKDAHLRNKQKHRLMIVISKKAFQRLSDYCKDRQESIQEWIANKIESEFSEICAAEIS